MSKTEMPSIRFYGFDNDWEQRKLKEIADKVTEKNGNLTVRETFTNSAEYGIISQRDFFDHDISNADNIGGYYVVRNEDFVYNPRISVTAPVGPINRNKLGRNGVMSPLYTVFRTHDIDTEYLEWFFKSDYWHSFMNFNGDSGARSDRFSIKDAVFFEMPIPLPSIDEQRRIGALLNQINNLITLHQRKFEKLTNVKKSMLEKMFPKDGAEVPDVRFREFSGGWEKHKVGDFLTESRIIGNTGLTAKKLTVKLWGKGVVEKSDAYGGSAHTQYYVRKAGQFMYGKLDFLHAAFGIVPDSLDGYESTLDSPAFDLSGIDGEFLMNTVIQENFYLRNGMIANGSRKAKRIHVDTFLEMDILTPSMEEQKKIGAYFVQLDEHISFAQIEIGKLQNLKEALLEKMFV